jgi:hypothetical protein
MQCGLANKSSKNPTVAIYSTWFMDKALQAERKDDGTYIKLGGYSYEQVRSIERKLSEDHAACFVSMQWFF